MQGFTDPPREDLTRAEVENALSWEHSTRLRFGVDLLDTVSFDETGIDLDIVDASVRWRFRANPVEGNAPVRARVRRTGTLRYRHVDDFNPLSVLYRVWVEMRSSI